MLNEDSSIIEFNTFNGVGNDIYPTLTICFSGRGIFRLKHIKEKYGTKTHYEHFLRGEVWDDKLNKVEYEEVSLRAELIFEHLYLMAFNESGKVKLFTYKRPKMFDIVDKTIPEKEELLRKNINGSFHGFPFRLSFVSGHEKCYSLDINVQIFPELKSYNLGLISTKIMDYYGGLDHFGKDKIIDRSLRVSVFLTYPNQLLRSFPMTSIGDIQRREERQRITIMTQGVEIIQRRLSSARSCKENWKSDDEDILKSLVDTVGCRPKYWLGNSSAKICQSQDSIKQLRLPPINTMDAKFISEHVQPCREIQTVTSTNTVKEITDADFRKPTKKDNVTHTLIQVQFKTNGYKEIRSVRAFNEESFIGNLGGYIGLFLGVAFWQIPDVIQLILRKLKITNDSKLDTN